MDTSDKSEMARAMAAAKRVYRGCSVAVDQLPYTAVFERMYDEFQREARLKASRNQFYRILTNLRKRGELKMAKATK